MHIWFIMGFTFLIGIEWDLFWENWANIDVTRFLPLLALHRDMCVCPVYMRGGHPGIITNVMSIRICNALVARYPFYFNLFYPLFLSCSNHFIHIDLERTPFAFPLEYIHSDFINYYLIIKHFIRPINLLWKDFMLD